MTELAVFSCNLVLCSIGRWGTAEKSLNFPRRMILICASQEFLGQNISDSKISITLQIRKQDIFDFISAHITADPPPCSTFSLPHPLLLTSTLIT